MNKIINLYIPDWLPMANSESQIKKTFKPIDNFKVFNWKIEEEPECKEKQIQRYMKVETLCNQLKNYINNAKDVQFNIIVDSFSQLILCYIYDDIKANINKLILINPFDKSIYLRLTTIKYKLLPVNHVEAVNKYIYLSSSLANMRDDPKWIATIRQEVDLFDDEFLLYHKIFDQLLKVSVFKKYFKWLENLMYNVFGIISECNPLINASQKKYKFVTKMIKGSGYCLIWESPEKLILTIKSLM